MKIEIVITDVSEMVNEESWAISLGNFCIGPTQIVEIDNLKKARSSVRRLLKSSSFCSYSFSCKADSTKNQEEIEARFLKKEIGFEEYRKLIGNIHKEKQKEVDEELKEIIEEERSKI